MRTASVKTGGLIEGPGTATRGRVIVKLEADYPEAGYDLTDQLDTLGWTRVDHCPATDLQISERYVAAHVSERRPSEAEQLIMDTGGGKFDPATRRLMLDVDPGAPVAGAILHVLLVTEFEEEISGL